MPVKPFNIFHITSGISDCKDCRSVPQFVWAVHIFATSERDLDPNQCNRIKLMIQTLGEHFTIDPQSGKCGNHQQSASGHEEARIGLGFPKRIAFTTLKANFDQVILLPLIGSGSMLIKSTLVGPPPLHSLLIGLLCG